MNRKFGIYILLTLFASVLLISSMNTHREESFYEYSPVNVDVSKLSHTLAGTVDNDMTLYNKRHEENYYICRGETCDITYWFKEPVAVKKVFFYLYSFPQRTSDITLKIDGDTVEEDTIIRDCDQDSQLCSFYIKSPSVSSHITLSMTESKDNNYGVKDIQFYSARQNSLLFSLYNFMFVWPRSIGMYMLYPLLFFILLITNGTITVRFILRKESQNVIEVLFYSFVSFGLFSLLSLILPSSVIKVVMLSLFFIFLYFIFSSQSFFRNFITEHKVILLVYLVSLVFLSGLMLVRDFPKTHTIPITVNDFYSQEYIRSMVNHNTYETDYLIPYQTSLHLEQGRGALNKKIGMIYNFADRTPLISLMLVPYLKAFGQNIFTYQMFTVFTGTLFIISFYFVSRLLVDKTKSTGIALILSFSHFFAFITPYWPQKTIALFFVFSSLYYILKKKQNYKLSGIHMLIAFLLHMYVVVYYAAFALFVAAKEFYTFRSFIKTIRSFLLFLIPTFLGFVIWMIFSFSIGQNQGIIWHIIVERSWSQSAESIKDSSKIAPSKLSSEVGSGQFWKDKYYNFIDLFTYQNHKGYQTRLFDFYKLTFPGSVGIAATIAFITAFIKFLFVKRSAMKRYITFTLFFVILPTVSTVLLHGFYIRTGVMSYLLGTVPLLLLFIAKMVKTKYFAVLSLIFIGESLYLYFIQDELAQNRLSYYSKNIPDFFSSVVVVSIVVSGLLLFLSTKDVLYKGNKNNLT